MSTPGFFTKRPAQAASVNSERARARGCHKPYKKKWYYSQRDCAKVLNIRRTTTFNTASFMGVTPVTSGAIFGTAFSFSWPFLLAAIPLGLAGLIYIFRKKGLVRDSTVVSSLFLIRSLPTYLPSRRRFVPPLAFWLLLVLLLLLSLAASGVVGRRTGERIAVLIDNSKSMGADLGSGESRLQSAIRIASADLRTHGGSNDLFSVYSVANGFKRVALRELAEGGDGGDASSQAIEALKAIEPSYSGDRLVSALSTLVNSYDGVWLYTDRAIDGQPPASSRLKITTIPTDPDLTRNQWLSQIALRDGGSDNVKNGGWFIDLSVSSVGGAANEECQVEALCFAEGLKPVEVERLSLSVKLRQRVNRVALGPLKSEWSYCRVNLTGLKGDLLASDNGGWVVRPQVASQVGLVSDTPLEALGVDKLQVKGGVVPVDIARAQTEYLRGVIYHRSVQPFDLAAPDLAKPTLIVYPALNLKFNFATVRAEVGGEGVVNNRNTSETGVQISRWDESHPVLRYARPSLLELSKARILECTEGAKAIISSTAGPIACAGERGGKRHLILGFEVFPFDGAKNPTVSIITLNGINWLFGDDSSALGAGESGAGVNFNIGSQGVLRLPQIFSDSRFEGGYLASDREASVNLSGGVVTVNTPGIISFKSHNEGSKGLSAEVEDTQFIALNSIVPEESDLLTQGVVNLPLDLVRSIELLDQAKELGGDSGSAANNDRAGVSYDGVLAALALGALFLTLLVRVRY
jgi:hypothetical protein